MKIQSNWISEAMKALETSKIVVNGEYESEFKGYISAFGAACIQSGLLPAVMFYGDKGNSKAERPQLIKAIIIILEATKGGGYTLIKDGKLADYILNHQDQARTIQSDVNKAATALKLSLRIYKAKKKKDE